MDWNKVQPSVLWKIKSRFTSEWGGGLRFGEKWAQGKGPSQNQAAPEKWEGGARLTGAGLRKTLPCTECLECARQGTKSFGGIISLQPSSNTSDMDTCIILIAQTGKECSDVTWATQCHITVSGRAGTLALKAVRLTIVLSLWKTSQ